MNNLNHLFDSLSMTLGVGTPSPSEIRNGDLTVAWLGLATFAWSMLFVWQGLDFTDMGFWLTGYQQFYTHPDTLDFQSSTWLTNFIGPGRFGIGRGRTGIQAGVRSGCHCVSDYRLSVTGIPATCAQSHPRCDGVADSVFYEGEVWQLDRLQRSDSFVLSCWRRTAFLRSRR
jgi:hypothetical protein